MRTFRGGFVEGISFYVAGLVGILACGNTATSAMSGVAVHAVQHVPECRELMWGTPRRGGRIVRADIVDNKVVAGDTIYHGQGHWPVINLQGTHVAFFRWGMAVSVNPDDKYLQCTGIDDQCSLAVMKLDGTELRNIVSVDRVTDGGVDQEHCPLDSPAGHWIYYERPTKTGEIWRVNINDPSTNEKVMSHPSGANIRFWSLSLDAAHAALQSRGGTWGFNGAYTFPDMSTTTGSPGCNASLSCGGNIYSHYLYAPHSWITILRWDRESYTFSRVTPYEMGEAWGNPTDLGHHNIGHVEQWLGETIHGALVGPQRGAGADCIQWSVNSEKWLVRFIGWCGQAMGMWNGTNQIAVNWVDREAVNLSRTDKPFCGYKTPIEWDREEHCPGTPSRWYSDMPYTGDLWIDLGAGNANKWEDEHGQLHDIDPIDPVSTKTDQTVSAVMPGGKKAVTHGRYVPFDLRGRPLHSSSVNGFARPTGIRIVRWTDGSISKYLAH